MDEAFEVLRNVSLGQPSPLRLAASLPGLFPLEDWTQWRVVVPALWGFCAAALTTMAWDKPGPLQLLLCANVLLLTALRSDHSAASWLPAPAHGCGPHGVLVQLVSCPLVLL
eukprot:EG_transcript_44578